MELGPSGLTRQCLAPKTRAFSESPLDFPVPRPARGIAPRQRVAPPGANLFGVVGLFESLQSRLSGVFDKLRGRGALTEADVDAALAEVRTALIDADVALPVVKEFIDKVRPRAICENVIRSVTPGQQFIKIVHDVLVETLGSDNAALNLGSPPAPILMVGLQGSGKTTTSAKLATLLQNKEKKKGLMASLDVSRPAAMEQLRVLGEQAGVATLPIVAGQGPVDIAKRAM